jgi:hypothetical protein
MKIALLFAGRIKAWEHCYPNFKKNILDPNSEHIIHSFLCHNAENPLPDIDKFIELYNVKKYENIFIDIEELAKQIPLNKSINGKHLSFKMYYAWHRAFQLMIETGETYDIVIYLRADAVFSQPLILSTFKCEENTLYVPSLEDWGGLNDQFAMGSSATMMHYTNIYNNIYTIYTNTSMLFQTEHYVKFHNRLLTLKRFNLNFSLHPARI